MGCSVAWFPAVFADSIHSLCPHTLPLYFLFFSAGTYVKAADDAIMAHLKAAGRLVSKGAITHSYPFCWRSETPLIYRAVPSWFVRVESIKDALLAANDQTYWVPESVKGESDYSQISAGSLLPGFHIRNMC